MPFDIDPLIRDERRALLEHPLFTRVTTLEDVRLLMELHVFAVWDFMTLLKRIQRDLTCVDLPWLPPAHRMATRLINEIVIGEESDEHPGGGFASHLELYLDAMDEIGADSSGFRQFQERLRSGMPLSEAMDDLPPAARVFVDETLEVALHGSTEQALAYFFFGREDIIPDMFNGLLERWAIDEASVPMLTHYLRRHIEMDGDSHGPAARRIITELIREPEQQQVLLDSARSAIRARTRLWDGALLRLEQRPGQAAVNEFLAISG